MATVDALVIGRKGFETVLGFASWPYGPKRVVVLSSRPIDFSGVRGGAVEQMAGPPAEIVRKRAASGVTTFTSTEEIRFNDFCAQASSNGSLSLEFPSSLETGFRCSAH
jgi:hypothetical protein